MGKRARLAADKLRSEAINLASKRVYKDAEIDDIFGDYNLSASETVVSCVDALIEAGWRPVGELEDKLRLFASEADLGWNDEVERSAARVVADELVLLLDGFGYRPVEQAREESNTAHGSQSILTPEPQAVSDAETRGDVL